MAGELIPFGPMAAAPLHEIARLRDQLEEVVERMKGLPKGADLFNAEQERQAIVTALWRAKGWEDPLF